MSLESFKLGKHVVGFVATSKIDKQMIESVHNRLDKALKKYDRVTWYCENASGEVTTFAAIIEDITYKIKHKDRFYKIAIVSDGIREKMKSKIECTFVNSECEFFPLSNRVDALAWVSN